MSHAQNQNPRPPQGAPECVAYCFLHPDGPGHALTGAQVALKAQVDKWVGAVALSRTVLTVALVIFSATITITVALVPSLIRSAVSTAVSAEFDRRMGVLGQAAERAHNSALIGTAQAAEKSKGDTP